MPLSDVDLTKYANPVFVETGTWVGDGVRAAVEAGFLEIYSMDVDFNNIQKAIKKTADLKDSDINLHWGASINILPIILNSCTGKSITFWLDAHPPGTLSLNPNAGDRTQSPLMDELLIIDKYKIPNRIILIDDMRLFSQEDQKQLERWIYDSWDWIKVYRIDGHIPNDIMVVQGV